VQVNPEPYANLLIRLQKCGLDVNRNIIDQDVKAGLLPRARDRSRVVGAAGLRRPDWVERRAFYLYRLRRRDVNAHVLRVLLFVRDGWGWEQVKPTCREGLSKTLEIQMSAVTRTIRKDLKPEDLELMDETILDEMPEHLRPKPELAKFSWGVLFFGKPLPGGSLMPLFKMLLGAFDPESKMNRSLIFALVSVVEYLLPLAGLTSKRVLSIVDSATAVQAGRASWAMRMKLRQARNQIRSHQRRQGLTSQSTNILTMFGQSSETLQTAFRTFPKRITPAQALGFVVCVFVIVEKLVGSDGLT
jgi:hypothetical protein